MPPRKVNNRTSTERKNDLLSRTSHTVIAMRFCKRCSSSSTQCVMGDASEKCVACVNSGKPCDLAIPSAKLRRIHKERIRLRDEIRAVRAKLNRLKEQLLRAENKEEEMMFCE